MKKNIQIGQYHFCHHRGNWSIYQYTVVSETGNSSSHVKTCFTYEDAVRETYRLNGWRQPEAIIKKF